MGLFFKLAGRSLAKNKVKTIVMCIGIFLAIFLLSTIVILYSSYNLSVTASYVKNEGDWSLFTKDGFLIESIEPKEIEGVVGFTDYGYVQLENIIDEEKPYLFIKNIFIQGELCKPISIVSGRLPTKTGEAVIQQEYAKLYGVDVGSTITVDIGIRKTIDSNYERWQNGSYLGAEKEYITKGVTKTYSIIGITDKLTVGEYGMSPGYSVLAFDETIGDESQTYIKFFNPKNARPYVDDMFTAAGVGVEPSIVNIFQESEKSVLLIITIVFCLVILVVCIVFILNSYMTNYEERIKNNAILSSLGVSGGQLFGIAMLENLFSALIVAPIAISVSYLTLYLSLEKIIYLIGNITFEQLDFVLNYKFSLISTVFFVGVAMSVLASAVAFFCFNKKNVIFSLRQNDTINIKVKKNKQKSTACKREKSKRRKIHFKNVETELAYLNIKRQRKHMRATIVSIILSIVLFLSIDMFCNGAIKQMKLQNDAFYEITATINKKNGKEIFQELSKVKGVQYGCWNISGVLGYVALDTQILSDTAKTYYNNGDNEPIQYMVIDDILYQKLLKSYGKTLSDDSCLAIATQNDFNKNTKFELFKNESIDVKLIEKKNYENVKIKEFNIQIVKNGIPAELSATIRSDGIKVFLNSGHMDKFFNVASNYYNAYFKCDDYLGAFATMTELSDTKGWKIMINNEFEYRDAMVNNYQVIDAFVKIFLVIVMIVSVINLFSSIIAGIAKRRKELAVLSSVGMEKKSIVKMLYLENIVTFLLALVISAIITVLVAVLMGFAFKFTDFAIPIVEFVIIGVAYAILIVIATALAINFTLKGNIIDNIKNEFGGGGV